MEVKIRKKFGWDLYQKNNIKLWFFGYFFNGEGVENFLHDAVVLFDDGNVNIERLAKWVRELSGHFAFVIQFSDGSYFASVDKICSTPLYTVSNHKKNAISNYAPYLKNIFERSERSTKVALEIAMSGFSIGNKTIYKNIQRLSAGECILWKNDCVYQKYYYTYYPNKILLHDKAYFKQELSKIILSTLKKTINSVNGRQIVLPLSAGNDSRLIASGLKHLGYENVICFTYGRCGNYEVNTSKEVASLLGYKWIYIQDRIRNKRNFFKSNIYKEYVETFESYSSIPNVQDIYEIYTLKSKNIIDDDAVIINGNSGDFISGGHVPNNYKPPRNYLSINDLDWSVFLDKHYSLWGKLRTKINDSFIVSELLKNMLERGTINNNEKVHQYALMECVECIGRQSRLVINQQRSYEFVGYEWRLPFWSEDFLNFWEGVPVEYKINQSLYKSVLMDNNWGGVWNNIKVNNKRIRPYSLWLVRWMVKILVSPAGKKAWHRIEKNMFAYWVHPTYVRVIAPYFKYLFDLRGHRGASSWLAKQSLDRYGFSNITSVDDFVKKD